MDLNQQLNLRGVLLSALKSKLSRSDYYALLLMEHWEEICGKEISGKTKPAALNKTVLTVRADNPVVIFELGFIRKEFVDKVNEFLSRENGDISEDKKIKITDIRFINR